MFKMEAYSEHPKPPEKCLWRLLCHPNIWLWFHVASVQQFLCCHRICCFGRKYPKGYLYAELSSEHFLIGSKSAPQNAIVPLDSLMVMNKNKGQIPRGKTSLHIQDPPCHFWRTMPNSTLFRKLHGSLGSTAQPLFAIALVHAGTATLNTGLSCGLVRQRPSPECILHTLLVASSSVECIWDSNTGRESHSPFC